MRVWIDEGCIGCRACEYECPQVFQVVGATSTVRGCARRDGAQDANAGRSPLTAEARRDDAERIRRAADGCPVSVIRFAEEDADDDACAAVG